MRLFYFPDNNFDIFSVFMNRNPKFEVVEKPDLLYGINQLKTGAQTLGYDDQGRLTTTDVNLTLIPYYAWDQSLRCFTHLLQRHICRHL